MNQLHIIRHGESLSNVKLEAYKEIPDHAIPLTEQGEKQAFEASQQLNQLLQNSSHTKIWSSPYKRALDTANIIAQHLKKDNIELVEETFLAEIKYGLFNGVPKSQWKSLHPEEYAKYAFSQQEKGAYWAQYPEGESCFDVDIRLIPVITDFSMFLRNNNQAHAVVVCHGAISLVLMRRLLNLKFQDFENLKLPKNAEIVTINFDNDSWELAS